LWTLHKDNLKRNHGVSDLFQVRVWSRVWASYVIYCEGDATRRQAVGWVGALKVFHRFVLSTVTSEFCISTCKWGNALPDMQLITPLCLAGMSNNGWR
jgi:hypothetical protein